MKAIILKPDDGLELINELELSRFNLQVRGETPTVNEIHRRFHFHVVRWMQKHGLDSVKKT